ncbi:MAG: hypothetical protein JKY50_00005 [Oleispira sp.]|nr:hypothetical protein [Oleispira sp.]
MSKLPTHMRVVKILTKRPYADVTMGMHVGDVLKVRNSTLSFNKQGIIVGYFFLEGYSEHTSSDYFRYNFKDRDFHCFEPIYATPDIKVLQEARDLLAYKKTLKPKDYSSYDNFDNCDKCRHEDDDENIEGGTCNKCVFVGKGGQRVSLWEPKDG